MTQLPRKKQSPCCEPRVTLKTIADHLGLTPGTVSAALNNSPAARSIPQHTKNRIIEAAQALNYRPNFFARTLRLRRTYTIGVIAEEIGDAYGAMVISGIEEYLRKNNYFFLTVIHRHDPKLLQTYAQMLLTRGVEGFITTDTSLTEKLALPTVAVAGHQSEGTASTAAIGEPVEKQLLARKQLFSALFAYNDISAIGSLWAFHEAGLRVPEDISVVGFDDTPGAAFSNPPLTTVRQPLVRMGHIAAQTVVDLIEGRGEFVPEIAIEPELVARQSTGPVSSRLEKSSAGSLRW